MKLLGSTKIERQLNKTKNENGENVSQLEISEKVLVYCKVVNNNYQHDSTVL